jgi:hypothetical protein
MERGGQLAVCQTTGGGWPATSGCQPAAAQAPFFMYQPPPFPSSCPNFFPHVINNFSLVPTHARHAQTSPKIFKHP